MYSWLRAARLTRMSESGEHVIYYSKKNFCVSREAGTWYIPYSIYRQYSFGQSPILTALHPSASGIDLDTWQSQLEIERYFTTINNG